ncbi:hypothetical protein [Sphingomonas sp.]|uniref:hypothetical protein n=1 Tax=Sphingomonas sp. TaxID=28214 RepID=UPI0031E38025
MLLAPALAAAQSKPVASPGAFVPQNALSYGTPGSPATAVTPATPLPVGGTVSVEPRREAFQLASGNTASSPATLFGGAYVLTQGCTTYGTVTLRYRGPDGVTMIGMVSKTAADSGGGTVVSFGGGAIVDVSLSGTAGCNVALSRVPQ